MSFIEVVDQVVELLRTRERISYRVLKREFDIEHLAVYLHAGARDISRARQGLELFAREVMPEFR